MLQQNIAHLNKGRSTFPNRIFSKNSSDLETCSDPKRSHPFPKMLFACMVSRKSKVQPLKEGREGQTYAQKFIKCCITLKVFWQDIIEIKLEQIAIERSASKP